ncbi:DNA-3-methyladenine glycosylase I [Lactobacillus sp. DCY120]|uniref:DNA-3-methyladenine glycosylase I n=1 Tax=Bombilactobacillus apium TaxID=2675299 RepID=A0A850RAI6_9LACO|nr:DNA-3-methyladenine glycosylase I [Bombilactobacillus apium]NVY96366.1 DNA-3-methyladenine glycosylase I [Bombilactobacillus apium]
MEEIYQDYLQAEWGLATHGDQKLFELLSLEIFQAGLSWITVLKKRPAFRQAFANFQIPLVASWGTPEVATLQQNPAIIRNQRKIKATIKNAQAILNLEKEQSFDYYLWSWVQFTPQVNHYYQDQQRPTQSTLSQELTQNLKKRGFQFVGPTTIYSFLEAAGMINNRNE